MYRVIVTPECRLELRKLREYIASRESRRIASNYLKRLKLFLGSLSTSPHRGEHREGIRFNQKSIGFEKRISVIFEVDESSRTVSVIGIRYAGRQLPQDEF